ncbi:MAG: 6-carboxytetrahydropterin synthase [Bryobacteraceae bacterium]|jgi:6-pyruvoyltetrahydropterin/6-carboxytetrahydropterin synthase
MFRVTRRYAFAASHRLHSAQLSEEENQRIYGKCNNPYGHGHNYLIEVSARGPADDSTGLAARIPILDDLVKREVLAPFDHRNLNLDTDAFRDSVPTTENLAFEIGRRLKRTWNSAFPGEWPKLEKVRIAETERNIFELRVDEIE